MLPFGAHKGYGLGLIDELYAGYIGGSLPEIRGTSRGGDGEKRGSTFYFQVIHPDAMKGNDYVKGRSQIQNVKAIIEDVLGHGNEKCLLPGQPEARCGRTFEKTWRPAVHEGGDRGTEPSRAGSRRSGVEFE